MLPKWLTKILPKRKDLKKQHSSGWLYKKLHDDRYWVFTKQSVARGVAAGLLVTFIPLPVQMISAAAFSILLSGNVIIATAITWISNPLTFIPINLLLYKVGQFVTHDSGKFQVEEFHITSNGDYWSQYLKWLENLGTSILIGIPIVSISAAILGFLLVHIFWSMFNNKRTRLRKSKTKK